MNPHFDWRLSPRSRQSRSRGIMFAHPGCADRRPRPRGIHGAGLGCRLRHELLIPFESERCGAKNGSGTESAESRWMAASRTALRPPRCPNPACDSHRDPGPWRFKKKGFFTRQHGPRHVQRYLCQRCQPELQYPDLLPRPTGSNIPDLLATCSSFAKPRLLWAAARSPGRWEDLPSDHPCSHLVERLGRHCLLLHEFSSGPKAAPTEPW